MTEWRPVLAPSVLLRHDKARDTELLVMPERVVRLKGPAAAILSLCDGSRTEADIVTELSTRFPGAPVAGEVPPFLARVRAQGWLR
jgi:pyrroloquinoline quinone biosynthesis protein D